MRWSFWLVAVLVLALLAGALFGVGQFLLPNDLAVTRTVQIDRPRATVFALSNDLRTAKEWSPFYAMDPDAEYRFNQVGPGRGQEMRWDSRSRRVGSGHMTIQDSEENVAIKSDLVLRDRARLDSSLRFERTEENDTSVAWTMSGQCLPGWNNVACRYSNLISRGVIQQELDAGLARLKTLAEQLPDADFEGLELSRETVPEQPILFVDVTAAQTASERDAAERDGRQRLNEYFSGNGIAIEGSVVRIFPPVGDANNIRSWIVGYPYDGQEPARFSGGVRPGRTPGGAVIRFTHNGPREQIGQTYLRACTYLVAHRELPYAAPGAALDCTQQPEGVLPWEVLRSTSAAPNPNTGIAETIEHTEIYYPVEERR